LSNLSLFPLLFLSLSLSLSLIKGRKRVSEMYTRAYAREKGGRGREKGEERERREKSIKVKLIRLVNKF